MATMPMSITDQEMLRADDHQDGTPREETQEMTAQEMDSTLLDAALNNCRVEMVPLDDIYVESDHQDDDLVKALAHSIGLIGLQNPICIVENDIPEHAAPYRLVSGRKRYAAFLQLQHTTIPAHILSYAETDRDQDLRKSLATTEENLVRKHYSLIELCELAGKSKEVYEQIHPESQQGKAKKPKHSGTESFAKPLAYLDVAAQQLGKSRATVWKYLCIYNNLIQGHPEEFAALKKCDHPILSKLEDLLALAKSSDLVTLTRIMCVFGMTLDDQKAKRCRLQEAQKRLEQYRAEEAREKGQPQVQEKGNAGEELPPQPPETPLPTSTLAVPTSSSAVEMSAPQPCDSTTPPPAEEDLVVTPQPEAPACIDPSSDEVLDTVEEVLIALDRHITSYVDVQAPHRFTRFTITTHKEGANELHVTIEDKA